MTKTNFRPVFVFPFLLAVVAALSAGCGSGSGSLSSDQQKEIATFMGGLTNGNAKPSVSLKDSAAASTDFMGMMREQYQGGLWLARFKVETGDFANVGDAPSLSGSDQGLTIGTCPTSSQTLGGASCSTSCPSSSSLKVACSTTQSGTATCNGTKYTLSSPSFSLTFDLSGVTGTTSTISTATGTFTIGMTFAANISGGSFDGKALSCSINLSFDIAKVEAGSAQTPTLSCDNFSCSYDGNAADCATIKSQLGSSSCS